MMRTLKEIGLKVKSTRKNKTSPYVTIELTGDCNDADYNIRKTQFELNNENSLNKLKKLIEVLRKDENYQIFLSHYFMAGEYDELDIEDVYDEEGNYKDINEDLKKYLDDLRNYFIHTLRIPSSDWGFCHIITDIKFYYTDENNNTLELELIHKKLA